MRCLRASVRRSASASSPAGASYYAAPTPERLAAAPLDAIRAAKLGYVVAEVHRTGRAARFDTDDPAAPGMPGVVRAERVRSALASPIVVAGELWGAITTVSRERAFAAGMERRLADFTELVATAISSLHARAEFAASRAPIAAAADEERRRVVRDLHDGAQQRLVHTVITLKLAQQALAQGAENGPLLVHEAIVQAERAMAEVRELAHGRSCLRSSRSAACPRASMRSPHGRRFPS
jgi:signal transduction histidine kinase